MELPPLASVEGAYWYLISLILGLAVLLAVYLLAVIAGVAPDPVRLFSVLFVPRPAPLA